MPQVPIRARLAAPTAYGRQLANTALAEYETYHEYAESDPPLRNRIRNAYCRGIGVTPPAEISGFAWSAVFISWCVKTAGATASEFRFAEAHSVFVHAAIANAIQDRGVFRGFPIETLAPQIGDIIQNNRGGNRYDYAARDHAEYSSHSAIVVDFMEERGTRFAITIGGNESDSIRRKRVELDARGFIVQRREDPYICVIQTLKPGTDAVVVAPSGEGRTTTLASSFQKHGTFIYDAAETVADYGSMDLTIAALRNAGMTHAWVRIHGTSAYTGTKRQRTRDLVSALQQAGIGVAGWGWCQGADAAGDAALALRESAVYGLRDYVADIEEGVNNAHWTRSEIETFCRAVRADLPGQFGITTFPLIDWHSPELMKAALPFVHFFNPRSIGSVFRTSG